MKFFILTLLFSHAVISQESNESNDGLELEAPIEFSGHHKYVSAEDETIYDVELIVFAYQNPLPNIQTYTNQHIIDDSMALILHPKPDDVDFIQSDEEDINDLETTESSTTLTMPLDEPEENQHLLAWFKHEPTSHQLNKIWDKLSSKQSIVPILHTSWRQGQPTFEDPIYVSVNNLKPLEIVEEEQFNTNMSTINSFQDLESNEEKNDELNEIVFEDFSITGMVAVSKGRYLNFENQLNLIRKVTDERTGENTQDMIFALTERRIIEIDDINYFDSPWFGTLVKVTEYSGEEENEPTH